MSFLEQIIRSTEQAVAARRERRPLVEVERALQVRPEDRAFRGALQGDGISVVAEFKRRWPSMGKAAPPHPDLKKTVEAYDHGGASAISILTEEVHFRGSLDDLRNARELCSLPIIRKDFIIDPYQVYEAAEAGADAVLLIVAALQERGTLAKLYELARSLNLDALVEVRNESELEIAREADVDFIGINNRDLDNPHDVAIDATRTLIEIGAIPRGVVTVSESGISTREQLVELERLGLDAALIGTALMMSKDRKRTCRELVGRTEPQRGDARQSQIAA